MSHLNKHFFPFVLALITVAIFFPLLRHTFLLFDDNVHLYENPILLNLSLANFFQFWKTPYFGLYVPVTYTVWSLVRALTLVFSVNEFPPAPYHAVNLALHATNGILVFYLLRALVKKPYAAFLGAAFFLLHPIQVEAVAWVAGLKDLLATFFSLLLLLAVTREKTLRWTMTPLFLLAMLSKPSAVVLPLLTLVFLRIDGGKDKFRAALPTALFWLALSALFVQATRTLQPSSGTQFIVPVFLRHFVAGDALAFYLKKIIFPFGLAIDYGRNAESVLENHSAYWTWLVPVTLALALRNLNRRWLTFGFLIFVVSLIPVLGLIPFRYQAFSTVADRYVYLGLLGPALIVAAIFAQLKSVRAKFIVGSLGLFALTFLTHRQLGFWRNTETCLFHGLSVNPASLIAHNNLGNFYERRGNWDKALEYYQRAVQLKPNWLDPHYNAAGILVRQHRYDNAQKHLNFIHRRNPRYADAYFLEGLMELEKKRPERAIEPLQTAISILPFNESYYSKLGLAYILAGRLTEAKVTLEYSVTLNPRIAETYNNLGVIELRQKHYSKAKGLFTTALKLAPNYAEARSNLASLTRPQSEAG